MISPEDLQTITKSLYAIATRVHFSRILDKIPLEIEQRVHDHIKEIRILVGLETS